MTGPEMPPPHRVDGGWWVPAYQEDGSPGWNWEPDPPTDPPARPPVPSGLVDFRPPPRDPGPGETPGPATPGDPGPPPAHMPGSPASPAPGPGLPGELQASGAPGAAALVEADPEPPPQPTLSSDPKGSRWVRAAVFGLAAVLIGIGVAVFLGGGDDDPATQPVGGVSAEPTPGGQAPPDQPAPDQFAPDQPVPGQPAPAQEPQVQEPQVQPVPEQPADQPAPQVQPQEDAAPAGTQ